MRTNRKRAGSALIEFTLIGISGIFITISIATVALDMWEYYSLAYATEVTSRYAGLHGSNCATTPNSCTVTVGFLVSQVFVPSATVLYSGRVNLTFTDGTGDITCNPASNCSSSSTVFPRAGSNGVGSDIVVKATYPLSRPVLIFWDGSTPMDMNAFTVAATSRQRILF